MLTLFPSFYLMDLPSCVPATVPLIPANLAEALAVGGDEGGAGGLGGLLGGGLLAGLLPGLGGGLAGGGSDSSSDDADELQTRDPSNGYFAEFDAHWREIINCSTRLPSTKNERYAMTCVIEALCCAT